MSRNYKTSKKNRVNYIYYSANGQTVEIKPNGEGITDTIIATLHEMDDLEVDANRRETYHVPIHLDAYHGKDEEDSNDYNGYLIDPKPNPMESLIHSIEKAEHEEKLDKLRLAIETLKPQQKELIQKVFYEKRTNVDIAKEDGVTEAAIRNRLKKIYENLRKKI